MKKTSLKAVSGKDDVAGLRKEVNALKRALAKMEKRVAELSSPKKLRATKLVVEALEVVDGTGQVVASIDGEGMLYCRRLWASARRDKRGVFIDGVTFRKVSAGELELTGPAGGVPGLEAKCWPSGGILTLRSLKKSSKQSMVLQSNGAPLVAYDETHGTATAVLSTGRRSGGAALRLISTVPDSLASASIGVSHSNGELELRNTAGKTVGKLP